MSSLKKGGFTFKRFFVGHDKSPMKVTTDSCLLGAWVPINPKIESVLDIGTGCGIIALMLAQRLEHQCCQIDAVDIDNNATKQCQENIQQSPFKQVRSYLSDINQFKQEVTDYYDLIITNPPYFQPAVNCRDQPRQLARYTESLNFEQLIFTVKRLLKSEGKFCLVLPYHIADTFKYMCEANQLFMAQRLNVRYMMTRPISLSLMCFIKQYEPSVYSELCIRNNDGSYTNDFRKLLTDFYLFRSKIKID